MLAELARPAPSGSPSSRPGGYPCYTTRAPDGSATAMRSCGACFQEAVDDGYRHVKLKVGANLDDDIRRLRDRTRGDRTGRAT